MNAFRTLLSLCVLAGAPALAAQHPGQHAGHEGDPMARLLFPPEIVMQHQADIALRPEQRNAITKAIQGFHAKSVDLQWRMQEQTQRLHALLGRPVVDQAATLAQVDEVLTVEREMKRAHLGMLIEIKNVLTAEQQAKLEQVRGKLGKPPAGQF